MQTCLVGQLVLTLLNLLAKSERITRHTDRTMAIGRMEGNSTDGILATASGARIATLLTYTGQSILALVVVRTLGSATGRRALELRQAIAARLTVLVRTLSIWSAWRWVAWITSLFWLALYNNRIAQSVGISSVTSDAFAVSTMLHRLTNCV